MKLFGKKEDLEGDALTEQISQLQASHEALQEKLDAANEAIVSKDQAIATLTNEKVALQESNDKLEQSYESVQSANIELAIQAKEAEESANAKATEIAASAGHSKKIVPEADNSDAENKIKALQEKVKTASGAEAYLAVKELQKLTNK